MSPIEALLFRLRQAARLADAERRLDALQAAQGAAQQAAPAPPAAAPVPAHGKAAGASQAPITDLIPEAQLQAIWQAIQTARWRPRRLIRLRIRPPLLSRRPRP